MLMAYLAKKLTFATPQAYHHWLFSRRYTYPEFANFIGVQFGKPHIAVGSLNNALHD